MLHAECSRDCRLICTASTDKTTCLYDAETLLLKYKKKLPDFVRHCSFSSDGLYWLAACDDGKVRCWLTETGVESHVFTTSSWVYSAYMSEDMKFVALAVRDRVARLFNFNPNADVWAKTPPKRFQHKEPVMYAHINPDSTRLCTAASAARFFGEVHIWDMENNKAPLRTIPHPDAVVSVYWSPDGLFLCSACLDNFARIFDPRNGDELAWFKHPNWVNFASYSPDGKCLGTACADGSTRIFDIVARQELLNFKHGENVMCALFSPNNERLITSGGSGRVRMWGMLPQQKVSLFVDLPDDNP